MLGLELMRQSTMIGFIEAFGFVTLSFLVLIPLVLLLRPQPADADCARSPF
jgi:DHA2 family multidrug resistance protein